MSIEKAIEQAVKTAVQPLEGEIRELRRIMLRQQQEAKPFLSVKETAKLLGVNPKTILNWVSDGKIDSVRKSARKILIPAKTIDDFYSPDPRQQSQSMTSARVRPGGQQEV